jgi:probable rRNA maturation factor
MKTGTGKAIRRPKTAPKMARKLINCDFYIDGPPEWLELINALESLVPQVIEALFEVERVRAEFAHTFDTLAFDIVLCNDARIEEINAHYRQKACPTDVITFALFSDAPEKIIHDGTINLGEVVISLETAQKQAAEAGHSVKKELLTLVAHAILHLLGFDHDDDAGYNFVVQTQNFALRGLSI